MQVGRLPCPIRQDKIMVITQTKGFIVKQKQKLRRHTNTMEPFNSKLPDYSAALIHGRWRFHPVADSWESSIEPTISIEITFHWKRLMDRRHTHGRYGKSKSATYCEDGMLLRHAWDSLLSCRPVQPNTDTSQYLCNMHINRIGMLLFGFACPVAARYFIAFLPPKRKLLGPDVRMCVCVCVGGLVEIQAWRHSMRWKRWCRCGHRRYLCFLCHPRRIDGAHFSAFPMCHVSPIDVAAFSTRPILHSCRFFSFVPCTSAHALKLILV